MTDMPPLIEELEVLVRARYPLIYIVSSEEGRVQEIANQVADRRQKKLFCWSCTTGILPAGTSVPSRAGRQAATMDPSAALDQVIAQVEPAVFLFKDFHPFLAKGQPTIIRKLKEISLHLKNSLKTVIIVSSVLEIPAELDKEITVLNLPLPGREELAILLDEVNTQMLELKQIQIDLAAADREKILQASLGLTLMEAENVLAKIIVKKGGLSAEDIPEIIAEKRQIVRKSGLLEYCSSAETFESIGGLDNLKNWLRKRAEAFTDEARAFGLPVPKGILLLGVQGCGKSLCAKAVSRLWQLPLLRFDMGKMFNSLVGSSEENVRKAIAVAESVAPAILWVDEIDKAFAGSQASGMADGGTTARVFATFLTWLSEKTAPVFVVATANDISQLPPELLRKGRLDEIFFVPLPDAKERAEIFGIHLLKRARDPQAFNLHELASTSVDFSGAEIEAVVVGALHDAFHERRELTQEDLTACIRETVPLSRTMDTQLDRLREWAKGRARDASASSGGSANAQA
jgi:SpoVK/Ycf46/Vps4 family AAA+-type ATPase